jgi:group I intron endonuclease
MWIYKITNILNNKIYIGQTIRPINQRFKRHLNDAYKLDTHLARAIRKYGQNNFTIEEIDKAMTQNELNKKEQYWIRYYDSVNTGYNETDAISKSGGNTYKSKTPKELKAIGKKIRQSKLGGNNPHSTKIIMIEINTNTKIIFNSQQECADYLHLASHMPISRRCRGIIVSPLNDKYMFEYYNG